MTLFKEKINFNDFAIITYQLGFSFFNAAKKYCLENNINYKEPLLFIITETIVSTITSKKICNDNIVDMVNKFVFDSFENDNKNALISYYLYIKGEIYDLVFNNIYIKNLVDFFLSEITDCQKHNFDLNIVAQLCDAFANLEKEIETVASNTKIIY